jgi:hypothetical protein
MRLSEYELKCLIKEMEPPYGHQIVNGAMLKIRLGDQGKLEVSYGGKAYYVGYNIRNVVKIYNLVAEKGERC